MRSNRRSVPLLAGGLLLVLAGASPGADDKLAETSYYPLAVGTTWHYKSAGGKISARVAAHEKIDGEPSARLEWRRDGKLCSVEHLQVTSGGVYRRDLQVLEPGKSSLGPVQTLRPAILLLQLPPRSGDKWTIEHRGGKATLKGTCKVTAENVKVPAGSYKALRVSNDLEGGEDRISQSCWYADGVGLVKQVIELDSTQIVIELEKMEKGK